MPRTLTKVLKDAKDLLEANMLPLTDEEADLLLQISKHATRASITLANQRSAPFEHSSPSQSKEAVEALYHFSDHCAQAKLGTTTVLDFIRDDLQKTSKAETVVIWSYDTTRGEWCEGLPKDFKDLTKARLEDGCDFASFDVVDPPMQLDQCHERQHFVWHEGHPGPGEEMTHPPILFLPFRTEDATVAVAELRGCPRTVNLALMENLSRIGAIFLQNNRNFLEAKLQRVKAENMLILAERLAAENLGEPEVLAGSIMTAVKRLIGADRTTLFLVEDASKMSIFVDEVHQHSFLTKSPDEVIRKETTPDLGIADLVVKSGCIININNPDSDERFNKKMDQATGTRTGAVLCVPVFYEGRIVAVAQLIREYAAHSVEFTPSEETTLQMFAPIVGVCLRNCRTHSMLEAERRKTLAILNVVRELSNCDIRNLQGVVKHVMKGARELLKADRATLFLVDKERGELHSKIADDTGGKEIRTKIGYGIAGTVARSGVGENISDAYSDPRFNRQVDAQLNYVTKSMLTEPIFFDGEVVAVAQLVNKLQEGTVVAFSQDDLETFRVFSLFAGISLSNTQLLEFAVKAGKEAMELQEMRNTIKKPRTGQSGSDRVGVTDEMVKSISSLELAPHLSDGMLSNTFDLFLIRENHSDPYDAAAALVVKMICATGLPEKFGCESHTLTKFVLSCRNLYRNVPYHNFYHAVDVCQTLITYLFQGGASLFIPNELDQFVLLITALVHDLDHMGLNNSFHMKTDSPLGILSSASGNSSVLEVHHCNLAIEILDDPSKNVFGGLSESLLGKAYRLMIDCVLATDMARHGELCGKFKSLLAPDAYDKNNEDHTKLLSMMLVKAADISNVTKPFDVSRRWGMSVTEEFYQQGDKERAKGVDVLPMFDRTQNNELAKGQIGFIDFVCTGFFSSIAQLVPTMSWCPERIAENRKKWEIVTTRRGSIEGV